MNFNKIMTLKDILKKLRRKFKSRQKKIKKTGRSTKLIKKNLKIEKYKKIIQKFNQFKIGDNDNLPNLRVSSNKFFKAKNYLSIIDSINNFTSKGYFLKLTNKWNSILKGKKEFTLDQFQKLFRNFVDNKKLNIEFFSKTKILNEKYNKKIGVIYYGDHNLIFISFIINLDNKFIVDGLTEVPIPSTVIGDTIVEDINELSNIILDSLNLLELSTSPLLVALSTSFFKIDTFLASDLKQISPNDSKVQSKSPYLPANTLVDFRRMSDPSIANSSIRTIYSNKQFIDSWISTLEIVDLPMIGLIPSAPNMFDLITSISSNKKIALIDIENSNTTLLIGKNLEDLKSHKLPFGYSLYLSDDLKESSKNYFDRVYNSIDLIFKDNDEIMPPKIFVMGSGLDTLVNKNVKLPNYFTAVTELNLSDYSYNPKRMIIHELISKSIESRIFSLASILKLCV